MLSGLIDSLGDCMINCMIKGINHCLPLAGGWSKAAQRLVPSFPAPLLRDVIGDIRYFGQGI